jgi:hypothetical protein
MSFNKPTYEGKINAIPIENTLIDPYTICVGTPLQYTVVTNADSNLTNVWEFGDGGLTAVDTVFHTYADTGYFHVNLFVNSYCDTIKGLVHVVAPPVIALGNDTTICHGSSLILDSSVPGNHECRLYGFGHHTHFHVFTCECKFGQRYGALLSGAHPPRCHATPHRPRRLYVAGSIHQQHLHRNLPRAILGGGYQFMHPEKRHHQHRKFDEPHALSWE